MYRQLRRRQMLPLPQHLHSLHNLLRNGAELHRLIRVRVSAPGRLRVELDSAADGRLFAAVHLVLKLAERVVLLVGIGASNFLPQSLQGVEEVVPRGGAGCG